MYKEDIISPWFAPIFFTIIYVIIIKFTVYTTYINIIYKYIVSIECAEPRVCVVCTLQPVPHRLRTVNSRLPSSINTINIAPGARKGASLIMRNDITQVYYRPLNFCAFPLIRFISQ